MTQHQSNALALRTATVGLSELLESKDLCNLYVLKDVVPDTEKYLPLTEAFLPRIRISQTDISDNGILEQLFEID